MEHNIGAFIARKRREMGYTQRQLAEQLNLSCQAVSKWENGATAPDLEEAERAVPPWHSGELMGHYADWLLRRTDEIIFDCQSAGIPHKHCMDVLVAEKMS